MEETIDIRHVAKLARLHVEDADVPRLQAQMADIVKMVEKLPDFEDTRLPLDEKDAMKLREDEVRPSMPREKVLANAPKTEAGCVVVPKIVEE